VHRQHDSYAGAEDGTSGDRKAGLSVGRVCCGEAGESIVSDGVVGSRGLGLQSHCPPFLTSPFWDLLCVFTVSRSIAAHQVCDCWPQSLVITRGVCICAYLPRAV
jgi:hypothetical protein